MKMKKQTKKRARKTHRDRETDIGAWKQEHNTGVQPRSKQFPRPQDSSRPLRDCFKKKD